MKTEKNMSKHYAIKKVPGLLTTTILERGITIPNVQVAVVGAEQQLFNSGALIQIGGRVGRSADFPSGDFVFFITAFLMPWTMRKGKLIG